MAIDYVVIAASVFFCIGFVGNSITVGFIVVSKKLHTPTYVTISCLAASDVLASVSRYVLILPDPFKSFLNENPQQYVYDIFTFLFLHSAFFHVVLLSYVRFVFITSPLQSLKLTCSRILFLSCVVWISSLVITLGYGVVQGLTLKIMITIETRDWCESVFALYVSIVPFIVVLYLNFRKLYYLYNQSSSVRRTRIANSMSVMFFIIIVIHLLTTIYPLFYTIDYAVLRNRSLLDRNKSIVHQMFSFSLIVNNNLNPLIYFMFSPPVLRLLSRLRKFCINFNTDL